jgi:hypothetical protein
MGCLLLAGHGANVAYLCTQPAQPLGERRYPAHPLRRHDTDLPALSAEPDTPLHQVRVAMRWPADHVIAAGLADFRAPTTDSNTVLPLLTQDSVISVHVVLPQMITMPPSSYHRNDTVNRVLPLLTRRDDVVTVGGLQECDLSYAT